MNNFVIAKGEYEDGSFEYVARPKGLNTLIFISGVGDTKEEAIESLLNAMIAYFIE